MEEFDLFDEEDEEEDEKFAIEAELRQERY